MRADHLAMSDLEDRVRLPTLDASASPGAAREEVFDRLTRLAGRLLGVPVTAITLVGENPHLGASAAATPFRRSLCRRVIADGAALVITEVAPQRVKGQLSALVDLLAAVPSVVYGFWGVFALIPAIKPVVDFLTTTLGTVPVIGIVFGGPFFGYSYFAAGLVLAIMVLPIIAAVCREVFRSTPRNEKEAALALGATRWEMIRIAVLPRARSGIVGASLLGLGRALGETIAVTMVIGNAVLHINPSIFSQGATMSSVIANEFTEATEPFHLSALFVVGFWLLIVALIVNIIARLVVRRGVAL